MGKRAAQSEARKRIVETAERLFYAEGVRAVGIDRIIAEAGVAKMTLYNHFSSKDDLILAVLEFREQTFVDFMHSQLERYEEKGLTSLEAFFAVLKDWFKSPGFRGCSFINASVELADPDHAASKFAAGHKRRFREMLRDVVTRTAGQEAASAVPAIFLLIEGAIVTAVMEGDSAAADVALQAALAIVPTKQTGRK